MTQPLVSVFMPTFSHVKFIDDAIRSAVEQDYANLEVVVGDDGSTDGTRERVREWAARYPARVLDASGEHVGIVGNCNRVLKGCRGKYIAMTSGDDLFLPEKISRQVAWMEEDDDRVMCGHEVEAFDLASGQTLFSTRSTIRLTTGEGAASYVSRMQLFPGNSMLLRAAALPVGGYDERVGVLALLMATRAGERSTLAIMIVSALILAHRQVRAIRASVFSLLLAVGLLGFTALGVYRGFRGLEDRQAFSLGISVGEFESVFGNAADLWTRRWDGNLPKVPGELMPSEILAPIPSQLLPFQKLDYADWYLDALYPELRAQGGGLAFGVLAQAAIGWGVLGLILRGAVTGLLFGALRRWYSRRYASAAVTVAYLWCVVFAYHGVRTGTLSTLAAFVEFVLLTLLLVVFSRHWRNAMSTNAPLA